jgi:hypothetical protein
LSVALLLTESGRPAVVLLREGGVVCAHAAGLPPADLSAQSGVAATSAPHAIRCPAGDMVAWAAADGQIFAARWTDAGWKQLGAITEGTAIRGSGGGALAAEAAGEIRVTHRDDRGRWEDTAPLPWQSVEAVDIRAGGLPGAAWVEDGTVHFARYERGAWTESIPAPPAPRAIPGTLSMWTLDHPQERTGHLAYRGEDGRVHELWSRGNSRYHEVLVDSRATVGRPHGSSRACGQLLAWREGGSVFVRTQRPGAGWRGAERIPALDGAVGDPVAVGLADGRIWVACEMPEGCCVVERRDGAWVEAVRG